MEVLSIRLAPKTTKHSLAAAYDSYDFNEVLPLNAHHLCCNTRKCL